MFEFHYGMQYQQTVGTSLVTRLNHAVDPVESWLPSPTLQKKCTTTPINSMRSNESSRPIKILIKYPKS
jgi:hypothetical protein